MSRSSEQLEEPRLTGEMRASQPTSRYVRRCAGCRQVRGISAFRVIGVGVRAESCRSCEEASGSRTRRIGVLRREINALRRREGVYANKLSKVREEMRARQREVRALIGEVGDSESLAPKIRDKKEGVSRPTTSRICAGRDADAIGGNASRSA